MKGISNCPSLHDIDAKLPFYKKSQWNSLFNRLIIIITTFLIPSYQQGRRQSLLITISFRWNESIFFVQCWWAVNFISKKIINYKIIHMSKVIMFIIKLYAVKKVIYRSSTIHTKSIESMIEILTYDMLHLLIRELALS